MLEPWRSQYLRALGVEVYLSRRPLLGAGPSHDVLWDETALMSLSSAKIAGAAVPVEASIPASASAVRHERPVPALDDLAPPSRRAVPSAESVAPQAGTTPSVRVRLMVATADNGVMFVDDMPGNGRDVQRLLGNLLFALQGRSAALRVEAFDWPLPTLRNGPLALTAEAARETLSAFINRKIVDGRVHTVLVLGTNAQRWLDGSMRQSLSGGGELRWAYSVSAGAVLSDALLKRRWWQDLRAAVQTH